ncbi:MAG: signal peptidase I [Chloroflexota bacterium]|nr:signal peptidase I [Chloroflexota bacterium]
MDERTNQSELHDGENRFSIWEEVWMRDTIPHSRLLPAPKEEDGAQGGVVISWNGTPRRSPNAHNPYAFREDEQVGEGYHPFPEDELWQLSPVEATVREWEYGREEPSVASEEPRTNWKAVLQEIAETVVLTLLIFVLMRALIQNYRIEGYSMEPNLHEQQYLIVNKVAYYFGEPQRGDVVVFEFPNGAPNAPEKDYIKRIIGLPGDTVECHPNELLVNGQVIDEPYGPNPGSYTCPPTTLGSDEYFVLGDNRNQSSDSHSWGPLERRYIIGKAWFLYWPVGDMGWAPNYQIEAPEPESPVVQTP